MSNKKSSKIPRTPSNFDAFVRSRYHEIIDLFSKHYGFYYIHSDEQFAEVGMNALFGLPVLLSDEYRDLLFRMFSNLFDVLKGDFLHKDDYLKDAQIDYSAIKILDLPFVLILKDKELATELHDKFVNRYPGIDYVSKYPASTK